VQVEYVNVHWHRGDAGPTDDELVQRSSALRVLDVDPPARPLHARTHNSTASWCNTVNAFLSQQQYLSVTSDRARPCNCAASSQPDGGVPAQSLAGSPNRRRGTIHWSDTREQVKMAEGEAVKVAVRMRPFNQRCVCFSVSLCRSARCAAP
jgi:hypothetical protein